MGDPDTLQKALSKGIFATAHTDDQRTMLEAIETVLALIEGWVDDVTAQVHMEEQVLQQERLASLGLLAAGVAHEMNTPLTGISSYAQLLLEDMPADDPRREMLEKIEIQTARTSRIANSLLNLARPERSCRSMTR